MAVTDNLCRKKDGMRGTHPIITLREKQTIRWIEIQS